MEHLNFKFPAEFKSDLQNAYKNRRVYDKDNPSKSLRWSVPNLIQSIRIFIKEELRKLNPTIYNFFMERSEGNRGFSKDTYYALFNPTPSRPLNQEVVDLFCYYTYGCGYIDAVSIAYIQLNRIKAFRLLKSYTTSKKRTLPGSFVLDDGEPIKPMRFNWGAELPYPSSYTKPAFLMLILNEGIPDFLNKNSEDYSFVEDPFLFRIINVGNETRFVAVLAHINYYCHRLENPLTIHIELGEGFIEMPKLKPCDIDIWREDLDKWFSSYPEYPKEHEIEDYFEIILTFRDSLNFSVNTTPIKYYATPEFDDTHLN